jgi:hypothetical protein
MERQQAERSAQGQLEQEQERGLELARGQLERLFPAWELWGAARFGLGANDWV